VKAIESEENHIILKGKYNLCILGLNEDDEIFYTEKLIDFDYSFDASKNIDLAFFEPTALVTNIDYKIKNDNILEVEVDLNFSGIIYVNDNFESITDLKIDEELPIEKDDDAVLRIYYAEKDETLWDIARKYNIPVDKVKLENEIEEDTLKSSTMLLIPM
ncbi:LysM peptidoglycan-binding domain-containing protein, partial [bacterium]|nr:LysM peptidoglycan-binding domain-containing protein [bacterium]